MKLGTLSATLFFAAALSRLMAADSSPAPGATFDSSTNRGEIGPTLGHSWEKTAPLTPTGRALTNQNIRVTQLLNSTVTDAAGDPVGTLSDIVLDPATGDVAFALVSVRPSGGASSPSGTAQGQSAGGKSGLPNASTNSAEPAPDPLPATGRGTTPALVAVPWSLIRPVEPSSVRASTSKNEPVLQVIANRARIEQAPGVDPSDTSAVQAPDFNQRVNAYFGVTSDAP